jgi:VanZ family protein
MQQQGRSELRRARGPQASPGAEVRFSRGFIVSAFVLILCATLTAGLWPFHSTRNEVYWLMGRDGIQIGDHGTLLGTADFVSPAGGPAFSLEIWEQPARLWTTGTILAFYDSRSRRQLSIEQDYTDLLVRLNLSQSADEAPLRIPGVFRKKLAFVTITSDGTQTAVYVDGLLAVRVSNYPLSSRDLSGQVIVGNSALRNRSWSGQLRGLAFYAAEFTAKQVAQNDRSWIQDSGPTKEAEAHAIAIYTFSEHSGETIHNRIAGTMPLNIPKKFQTIDQRRFELAASEFHTQPTYVKNAILNVAGFIPLGFVTALLFAFRGNEKQGTAVAILIGLLVSLTIEYFQSFLPTRFSGTTDLLTNTFGAWLGAMILRFAPLQTKIPG